MSRLPSTSRRSGKNKLNRHLDHRRKTRVQLIRQHKSCNLSLPSAQVANELPGGLPERFHWPFLGSAQHHATNVSPSVCRSDPPAEPFVRVYDPWHELKFFLLLLPRNCWLTSHQVQAASTSTCSIFIYQKKTNKLWTEQTHHDTFFELHNPPWNTNSNQRRLFFPRLESSSQALSYRLDWSLSRALRSELLFEPSGKV